MILRFLLGCFVLEKEKDLDEENGGGGGECEGDGLDGC
jgi:hypothetical protein